MPMQVCISIPKKLAVHFIRTKGLICSFRDNGHFFKEFQLIIMFEIKSFRLVLFA